jgi:hypothetical protein
VGENKKSVLTTIKSGQFLRGNKKVIITFTVIAAIFAITAYTLIIKNSNELGNTSSNMTNGGIIAEKKNWIYYSTQTGLYKMSNDGNTTIKLYDKSVKNINVMGNWLYFNTNDNQVLKMKTDGSELTVIAEENKGLDLSFVTKNHLYFYGSSTEDKKSKRFIQDINGGEIKELSNSFYITSVKNGSIYGFRSTDSQTNVRKRTYNKLDAEGNVKKNIFEIEIPENTYWRIMDDKYMYYSKDFVGIYKYDMTDGTETQLIKDVIQKFRINKGYIYYNLLIDPDAGDKSGYGVTNIYRITLEGTGKEKVIEVPTLFSAGTTSYCDFNIAGNWVFYYDIKEKSLCRVNFDGTRKTKLD